jgi:RES domain-containing protein
MPELAGFRVASWDTPLRVNPNRQPGRWNLPDSGPTQYIALHPLATWAEYLRWHEIRGHERLAQLRLGVWAIRAQVEKPLSVGFDDAARLELEPEALVSDDWSECQAAAERLRGDRSAPKAFVVPSAALPGARNLVILEARVPLPYSYQPLDPIDTPVTLAAAGARPPASLLELIRYRGEVHAELEAWRRGERFQLVEPNDTLLAEEAARAPR